VSVFSQTSNAEISESSRKLGTLLLYTFLVMYYLRPQELLPFLKHLHLSGIVYLLLTLWGWFHLRKSIFSSPVNLVFLFGLLIAVSALGAVNAGAYRLTFKFTLQIFPMCVAMYLLIDSKYRVQRFFYFWSWIYIGMAFITINNRPLGPGDFTNDPNDAALALGMGLPFVFYSIYEAPKGSMKRYFRYVMFLSVLAGIILTSSRGGFLGAIICILVLWFLSKNRLRTAIIAIMMLILSGGLLLSMLPERYIEDMQSISDTEDSTRVERLRSWELAWMMYKDNPVIGVGAGNFPWNVVNYQHKTDWGGQSRGLGGRQVHSMYFEVLADLGTLGMLLFLYIVYKLPFKLYKIRNQFLKDRDDLLWLKMLMQVLIASMSAYATAGAFVSVAYYPHLAVWITLYAICMRELEVVRKG
jgi:probable O-glycosylation ligase (exosortase A-associated)